ncbi:outer membrane beta-barrel protein [Campylobacter canadensis]|nr:outer membrane beta-barrel protein [Campylobacter canadensis]
MKKLSYALAALCCSSALYAQNFSGLEITPTIGWVVPEGNLDLKSKANYGIRIGQMYEYVGTELGYEFAKAKFKNSSSSFNVHRGFLNLLLPFSLGDSKFDLYGLIGAGYENFGKNLYGNKNGGFGHYGLGLKYKISDYFGLRAEVRDELAFNRANHHLISTLGFVFNFDTNKKSVLPVQEEVKQEVKEEVKQEVKEEVVPSVEEIKQACYDLPTEYVYFAVNKANVEPKYNENLKYLVSKAN